MNSCEKVQDSDLKDALCDALVELERRGDIVICSNDARSAALFMESKLRSLVPSDSITPSELRGVRSLIFHAVGDGAFFDWEMPILTGLSASEFIRIANKLPAE